jgi:hypothetical protein
VLLATSALAGVVVAHALDYLAIFPDPDGRAHELARTGHSYWPAAVALAVVAGIAVLGTSVWRGIDGGLRRASVVAAPSWPARIVALACWQASLFTVQEITERFLAHEPVREVMHGGLYPAGLVAQALVAAGIVAVLWFVERRVARCVTALTRRPRSFPRAPTEPVPTRPLASRLLWSADQPRGPPRPAAPVSL